MEKIMLGITPDDMQDTALGPTDEQRRRLTLLAATQPKAPVGIQPAQPIPSTSETLGIPNMLGGSKMPSGIPATSPSIFGPSSTSLGRPTPAESHAAGRQEFASGMPSITAKPFTSDYYQQQQEKNAYEKAHPWGSDISAHPGTLGKIGHVLGEIGNVAGDVLAPRAMSLIPGTQLNREVQERQNEQGFEKAQAENTAQQDAAARTTEAATGEKRLPIEQETADVEKYKAENRTPTTGFQQWRLQNPNAPVDNWLKLQNANKPPTNPFEAFAYGTPEERKAAQDFLALEKRTGAQYRTPSEIDERYSLYKRDPDAYRAMFGNRGDAQDQANSARTQAQATRMLKYFDAQRREIQNSFLMDDTEKQQRLSEIDQLEKPYQDSDTIQVINPNGTRGTIPVSNIKKALSKGYKVVPNQ